MKFCFSDCGCRFLSLAGGSAVCNDMNGKINHPFLNIELPCFPSTFIIPCSIFDILFCFFQGKNWRKVTS